MKCCLQNCRNNVKVKKLSTGSDWITFHSFPKNQKLRASWLQALSIPNWLPLNRSVICSDHFKEDDFYVTKQGIRRIKYGVVPFIEGDCSIPAALRVCKLCLSLDSKMYQLKDNGLAKMYQDIMGIAPRTDANQRLPMGICWECTGRLQAAASFRSKALFSDALLQDHLKNNDDLNITDIQNIHSKHTNLKSSMVVQEVFKFDTHNSEEDAPSTLKKSEDIGIPHNEEIEIEEQNLISEKITIRDELKNEIIEEACPNTDVKHAPNTFKISEVIGIPNNEEIEIEVQNLICEKITIRDELKNEIIEEACLNTDVKTEIDLIPITEIDIGGRGTDLEDFSDNDCYIVKENVYVSETKVSLDNIVKSDGKHDTSSMNLSCKGSLGQSDKNVYSDDGYEPEIMDFNDDVVSDIDDDESTKDANKAVMTQKKTTEVKKGKTAAKRKAKTNDDVGIRVKERRSKQSEQKPKTSRTKKTKQPYVKPSIPIDEKIFTVKTLNHDDLRKEILGRRDGDQYKLAPYKCDVCFRGFPTLDKQARHVIKHSEQSGPIKCNICNVRMAKSRFLRAHIKRQHTSEFICKLCPLVTRNRNVAIGHMKYHQGDKYQCPQCFVEFEKKSTLLYHLRLKHVSDCVCELCGYTFLSNTGVEMHKRMRHKFFDKNTEYKGQYCDVCEVKFLNQKAYKRHLRLSSKHIKDDDPNRMSNDSSIKQRRLGSSWVNERRRSVIHHRGGSSLPAANTPLTCEQCGVVLENLSAYSTHFKYSHPGINSTQFANTTTPYMCEHCGKFFLNKTILSCHMSVHTGQKRFQCDHCHMSFTKKANLADHMRQHVRRTYNCRVCGKRFTFSSNLIRHMFLHTGLRPFKCDACEKTFRTKGELRSHVDHVHLKKPRPKRVRRKAKKCEPTSLEY